jgi:hypothetical protein
VRSYYPRQFHDINAKLPFFSSRVALCYVVSCRIIVCTFKFWNGCTLRPVQKLALACDATSPRFHPSDFRMREGMAIVDLGVLWHSRWVWMEMEDRDGPRSLPCGSVCASLLWPRPTTLHRRPFGNRDAGNRHRLIHILKDETLKAPLQFRSPTYFTVEHLLD